MYDLYEIHGKKHVENFILLDRFFSKSRGYNLIFTNMVFTVSFSLCVYRKMTYSKCHLDHICYPENVYLHT